MVKLDLSRLTPETREKVEAVFELDLLSLLECVGDAIEAVEKEAGPTEQFAIRIEFRVVCDHLKTVKAALKTAKAALDQYQIGSDRF